MADISSETEATFRDPLTPDIHVQLDTITKYVTNMSIEEHSAQVLYNIIGSSVEEYAKTDWPINAGINIGNCGQLLASNPNLKDLLKEAHRSGKFTQIRSRAEFHIRCTPKNMGPFPSKPGNDVQVVKKSIETFITRLRPVLKKYLKKPRLSIWSPPEIVNDATRRFYSDLAIPSINGNRPNLLLHDGLSTRSNPHVENLFKRGDNHRILWNTSGAGKTTLLFQGLCLNWGFYFVSAQDSNDIGQRDLESMIYTMGSVPAWTHDIFKDGRSSAHIQLANDINEQIAFNRVLKVLLARWVVFCEFITIAKQENNGYLPDSFKKDWLLLQILPLALVEGRDPFITLVYEAFIEVTTDVLLEVLKGYSAERVLGSAFDPECQSFFYILDEAQAASKLYMGAFSDGSATTAQPVLRPLIRAWSLACNPNTKFIVSGTGFSLSLFKTVLTPRIGNESLATQWDVVHSTGDFVDRETQESYIKHYLPAAFCLSPSGTHLLTRMHEWLRGRHRFTARFIEDLLTGSWDTNGPRSPHRLLNAYVNVFTDFTPIDYNELVLDQEPEVKPPKINGFPWELLTQDKHLMNVLAHSISTYMTRGIYPMWHDVHQNFVEYGIARFVGDEEKIIVEEPMSLVGVVRFFAAQRYTLDEEIQRDMQSNKGQELEQVILLSFTKMFGGHGTRLDQVFTFLNGTPSWAHQVARIVGTPLPDGSFSMFDFINGKPAIPSAGVALYAEEPRDVQEWFELKDHGFCIPGTAMGPDIMTWMQLADGRLLLVLVQVKVQLTGNADSVKASDVKHAIMWLSPANFFHGNYREDVKMMLAAINKPEECFTGERLKYNILRVIATYPLDVIKGSSSKAIKAAMKADGHPLAVLDVERFASSLATTGSTPEILASLEKGMKRTRGSDKDGSRKARRMS